MPARRNSKSGRKSEQCEERTFLNPSSLSQHLLCPICQEAFANPQRAPCGHSFCKNCIEPWLKNNPICPVDRKKIAAGSMHHDFIVQNIIGDYTVACPWRALGCDFIGPLYLLPDHKKSCVMNPDSMPPALRAHTAASLDRVRSNDFCVPVNPPSNSSVKVNFVFQKQPSSKQDEASILQNSSTDLSPAFTSSVEQSSLLMDDNSVLVISDDEANLPPAPPPSLLLRLYQNSDSDCRNLLCNFIENDATKGPTSHPPKRRRRGK